MPKCYSEQERAYIRSRLKEEAANCLAQYGVRRTTVDEIVRRVNIPKGTFYLFYRSKELLLFEVMLGQHDVVEQKLFQAMGGLDPAAVTAEQLTDILFELYKMASEMPVLRLLNSSEVDLLARKLPQEVVEAHLGHDNHMVEDAFAALPLKPGVDAETCSAAFHALYFVTLQSDATKDVHFDGALRMLIYGLVTQMI